jgi:hypothetical protein
VNHLRGYFSTLVVLTIGALVFSTQVRAQSLNPCDRPKNLPSSFFEVPAGPQGMWSATLMLDLLQAEDPRVPVVVVGVGAIQGPANRRGMRLGCGVLRNRSLQPVRSIQLRWILANAQDRAVIAQRGHSPQTIIQQGHTQYIELSISPESLGRTDFSVISFAEVTHALQKEGILNGDYHLYVGVNEVLFVDGTSWRAASLSN